MKQIQILEQIEGKTVAKVYMCFEELWISFTDESFIFFRAENNYGDTSLELVIRPPNLLENATAVTTLGLVTPEEVQAAQKEKQQTQKVEQERFEKAQLAALLAKYPRQ